MTYPHLAPLSGHYRKLYEVQIEVVRVRYKVRYKIRDEDFRDEIRDEDFHRTLTRAEVLRMSAGNALDFTFPIEKHGERVFVDLRRLDDSPNADTDSNAILVIDASFLSDLKRLKLVLKDGRLYAKTFRQTLAGWKSHLCPVISIVAAKKYGQNWDVTFLSARTVSGDSLDLRSSNVRIPALEDSTNTQKENAKLDKDTLRAGFRDGWLTADNLNARPKKPKGAAPDSDEEDMTQSKMDIPATEGQIVEAAGGSAETSAETSTNVDLFVP
jgi:hypothetical protein